VKRSLRCLTLAGLLLAAGGAQAAVPAAVRAEAGTAAKLNMSYVYFGIGGDYVREVDAANGALQLVAPNYFELDADGGLKVTEQAEGTFTAEMHDRGLRVVPFLSNDWDRDVGRKALAQREKLSDDLAAAVARLGLDGVNVDIENVTEADRDAYTDFIRLLRAKLPAGKEVSVAVAANPYGEQTGWAAAYDIKELARYCDYLLLMAYDESYPGDPTPGPVAGLPFVEASVQAALQQVSPDKLVLGLPFYGRLWKDGDASWDGTGVSAKMAETLVSRYHGQETYDETQQSVKATFTIGPGDPPSQIMGRTLPAGSYTVWYENDRSLQAKLAIVEKYGLRGTGSWSLSQETAAAWTVYTLWAKGVYFLDTSGHWAESDIRQAAEKGWMTGTAAGIFAPDQALTRAEAAAVLVRALGLSDAPASGAAPFADVSAGHWAAHDIAVAAQRGYIDGVAAGKFAPDQPITREQMCALLARVLALPASAVTAPPYRDVPAERWSAPAVAALSGRGVVDGFDDGTFRPQAPITRAEMAALLVRLAPSFAAAGAR
jgi:spore germination protein YaaH